MAISLSLLSSVRGQIKWEKGQRGKEKRKKTNEMKQIQQKQRKIKREGGHVGEERRRIIIMASSQEF